MEFKVGNRELMIGKETYFIADISANHDGDLQRAIDLIHLSKEAGADCAKFQHFEAKSIVSEVGFTNLLGLETHQTSWKKSVTEIYDQYHTKREWDDILIDTCLDVGIDFMTTPYNLDAVDYFENYLHAYKIGSGDITYKPLLEKLNAKKKPVFLATGASEYKDVERAMQILSDVPICVMQCNTNYTASLDNFRYLNLNVLRSFAIKFPGIQLGFSDHTHGHSAVLGAVALGAVAVEKHFTDDNERVGPDHTFALNPKTWCEMVARTRELELSLGDGVKCIEENEKNTVIVQRRSIRVKHACGAGHLIKMEDLEYLRPCESDAINPMEIDFVLGKKIKLPLNAGESLRWSNLEN